MRFRTTLLGKAMLVSLVGQTITLPERRSILYAPPEQWQVKRVHVDDEVVVDESWEGKPDGILVDDEGRMLAVEFGLKVWDSDELNILNRLGLLAIEIDLFAPDGGNLLRLSHPWPGAQAIGSQANWLYQGAPGTLSWVPSEHGASPKELITGNRTSSRHDWVSLSLVVEHTEPHWTDRNSEQTGFNIRAESRYLGRPVEEWRWRFHDAGRVMERPPRDWDDFNLGQACELISENIKLGEGFKRIHPPELPARWTDNPDDPSLPVQECLIDWDPPSRNRSI